MSTDAKPTTGTPATNGAAPSPRKLDPNVDKLPLDAEGWAYLADLKWVNDEYNRGTWIPYAGSYIAVARKQFLAHGSDPILLREQAAKLAGLDPERIAITYVDPGIES